MRNLNDFIGKRFGNIIITERVEQTKVKIKCDCGVEIIRNIYSILDYGAINCGIGRCRKGFRDLTGKIFDYLTVESLNIVKRGKGKGTYWNCRCICGNIKIGTSRSLLSKYLKSCGCKTKEITSKKFKKPNFQSLINQIYKGYEYHAKKLNLEFSITKQEFEEFLDKSCFYCNEKKISQRRLRHLTGENIFEYNGIDRVDNNIGYRIDNCVTACKLCNYAKRALSSEDFINLAEKIVNNHKRKMKE